MPASLRAIFSAQHSLHPSLIFSQPTIGFQVSGLYPGMFSHEILFAAMIIKLLVNFFDDVVFSGRQNDWFAVVTAVELYLVAVVAFLRTDPPGGDFNHPPFFDWLFGAVRPVVFNFYTVARVNDWCGCLHAVHWFKRLLYSVLSFLYPR